MASYILKRSTDTVFFIRLGGSQVGSVQRRASGNEWVARINKGSFGQLTYYGRTAVEAFHEVVAASNRVDLCGKDDREAARVEVDRRNEEYRRINQPIVDSINEAARALNLPVRSGFRRGRKFRI